ncbi:unnamed protein product [Meloidogyne enterolobii]|uniref:Uncharacterized protein n=1 Tax=Meloidogyne enterolobii TaxID=390850 RepID=A0ACB1ARV3_MELEN
MRLVNFMFLLLYVIFQLISFSSNPLKSLDHLLNPHRFQIRMLMSIIKFSDIPLALNQLISVFRRIPSKILIAHLSSALKSAQIPLSISFSDNTLSIQIVFFEKHQIH